MASGNVGNENMKKIAELRTMLEERVTKMEKELDQWRVLLDLVNTTLLKEGFRKAEIAKAASPAVKLQPAEKLVPP
ncbi:hypothetical protein GWN49_06675, partial [Candidatus Bathyarchaeota archaeon]|nr:hypothetical protein [Candidatus Bathyarchaeota archaeon]